MIKHRTFIQLQNQVYSSKTVPTYKFWMMDYKCKNNIIEIIIIIVYYHIVITYMRVFVIVSRLGQDVKKKKKLKTRTIYMQRIEK